MSELFRASPQQRSARTRGERWTFAWTIEPALDFDAAARAHARCVALHEILRSRVTIPTGHTELAQEVTTTGGSLERLEGSRDEAIARWAGADELCAGLLDEGSRSLLVLHAPGSLADASSLHVFAAALVRLAAGEAANEPEVQYADLAAWANEQLERPIEDATPVATTAPVAMEPSTFDAPSAEALLAATAVVLGRLTGDARPRIGWRADGRTFAELVDALGPIDKTAVLGIGLDDAPSFADATARAAHARTSARDELERLVPSDRTVPIAIVELPPRRHSLGRFTTSRVAIRSEGVCEGALVFDGTTVEVVADESSRGFAARFSHHVAALLDAGLATPDVPVDRLSLHDDATREELLALGRGQARPLPTGTVLEAIAAIALARPNAIAVSSSHERVTYGELHERTRRLARALVAAGVRVGDRVALCLHRSSDQVVAMLGTMAAGAAYVPLDPGYPRTRLELLAADAGAVAWVTHGPVGELARSLATGPTIDLDDLPDADVPLPRVGPDDLAYVIYTSGSTGTPKGVELTHGNLAASNDARLAHYGPSPSRYLLLSSYAFDSSVAGLYWTLGGGGALVLPEPGREADVVHLHELVRAHEVSHLLALPSLYDAFLRAMREAPPSLRVAIVAGEACAPALVRAHHAALPSVELHDEYGPTENTVWSTVQRLDPSHAHGAVPIGRPIARVAAYVLDAHGGLAPRGAIGELAVGGPGVARGYLGRPELTAERFVADRFGGGRMYRTGDRVAWRDDGTLAFHGRGDGQIKVRGHRIELGEIEAALLALPEVAEGRVVADDGPLTPRRLATLVAEHPDGEAILSAIAAMDDAAVEAALRRS